MDERVTTETKTTIHDTTVKHGVQTTNVNIRPDGGADVQVNEPAPDKVVEETTTTTTRRAP